MRSFRNHERVSWVYILPSLLALLIVIYLVSLTACSATPKRSDELMPSHHTNTGFRNRYIEPLQAGFITLLRMRYFGDEEWADYAATAYRVEKVNTPLDKIYVPGIQPQVT